MTTPFVPDPSTMFYMERRPYITDKEDALSPIGVMSLTKTKFEQSHASIYYCVARDKFAITMIYVYHVDERGTQLLRGHQKTLPIKDYIFHPVGPEILKALELNDEYLKKHGIKIVDVEN